MENNEINNYLSVLINKPLSDIGRIGNMAWFGFGETLSIIDPNGNTVKKDSISLHVQCAWRLVDKENKAIIIAYSDIYEPNSIIEWSKSFEWDIQGNNLFDEKAKEWIRLNPRVCVKEYKLSMYGDLLLILSNGNILDIFVDASAKQECWRLFEYESDKDHFVVNGKGVVFEYEI